MINIGAENLESYYIETSKDNNVFEYYHEKLAGYLTQFPLLTSNIQVLYHLIEKHKNDNSYKLLCTVYRMAK